MPYDHNAMLSGQQVAPPPVIPSESDAGDLHHALGFAAYLRRSNAFSLERMRRRRRAGSLERTPRSAETSELVEMVRPLELELNTYERERERLEDAHRGKFVVIRGERIAGIFDHFHAASQHAARQFKRESYLIHCIGAEMMRIPAGLLDGLAAICTDARACRHERGCSPMSAAPPLPARAGGGRLKS